MNILIDTQIFLWLFGFADRITLDVESLLKRQNSNIYFSSASVWEIAIKYSNRKLQLPDEPQIFIPDRMNRANFKKLEITHQHALAIANLPHIHKDPFDRLLIAQATVEKLTLLSSDSIFAQYNVKFIDSKTYTI